MTYLKINIYIYYMWAEARFFLAHFVVEKERALIIELF